MENIIAFRSFFVNGHYTHIYSVPEKHFLHGLPRTEQDFLSVGHRRRSGILRRRNAGASGRHPAAYVFSAGCGAVLRGIVAVRIPDFSLLRNDFCRPVPCTAHGTGRRIFVNSSGCPAPDGIGIFVQKCTSESECPSLFGQTGSLFLSAGVTLFSRPAWRAEN